QLRFVMTPHAYVGPASVPGSVAAPVTLIAVPSGELAGAPVIVAVGFTFVTATVLLAVPTPPSLSVTVRVTTYVALSSGVKLNVAALPVLNAAPFFVTFHA